MGHPCTLTTRHITYKLVCQDVIFLDQFVISWLAHILSNMWPIICDSTIFLITLEIAGGVPMVTMYCPWKFPGPQFLKLMTMCFLWQKDFSSCNWVCELGMKKVFCIMGGRPTPSLQRKMEADRQEKQHEYLTRSWFRELATRVVGAFRSCRGHRDMLLLSQKDTASWAWSEVSEADGKHVKQQMQTEHSPSFTSLHCSWRS